MVDTRKTASLCDRSDRYRIFFKKLFCLSHTQIDDILLWRHAVCLLEDFSEIDLADVSLPCKFLHGKVGRIDILAQILHRSLQGAVVRRLFLLKSRDYAVKHAEKLGITAAPLPDRVKSLKIRCVAIGISQFNYFTLSSSWVAKLQMVQLYINGNL